MSNIDPEVRVDDRHARLERQLITEYLKNRGLNPEVILRRADPDARYIMQQACGHASQQLAQHQARAGFVREIHGATVTGR
jgi:hypothetical protein